jgi:hypothetical protein
MPYIRFKHVIMVGCGGTGSQAIASLVNLILSNSSSFPIQKISFVDPDIVESQNLRRQGFFGYEEGDLKAFCLKRRYDQTLQTQHFPVAFNVENGSPTLEAIAPNRDDGVLFLCTVDNFQARRHSLELLQSMGYQNYLWISPGNREFSGQVLSHLVINGETKSISPLITHPEISGATGPGLASDGTVRGCGATGEGGMQHFLSNIRAANLMVQMITILVERGTYISTSWFTEFTTEYSEAVSLTES